MNSIEKEITNLSGYKLPFEGNKHLGTIIMLPYREDTWRNEAKDAIEEYLNVVKAISKHEMVIVVIDPRIDYKTVSRFQMKNTHILRIKYDDAWARDIMPIFMVNDNDDIVGIDFAFNAWGGEYNGLYSSWVDDDNAAKIALLDLMIPRFPKKDFILEGGSICSNGNGILLTTECCLLSKGRNSNLSKEEIEKVLKDTLNLNEVIFLPNGVYEDETDGHVDNIACFLDENTIALGMSDDINDPQYKLSLENYEFLNNLNKNRENKFKIIIMQLPKPLYMSEEESKGIKSSDESIARLNGRRLAASYVNFYQGEDFVILPQFNVPEDKIAYDILNEFYQGKKEIIPIYSREILLGGGNIHCITMQIPFTKKIIIEPEE